MNNLIIIGAPNSGKTTQIANLRERYHHTILELDEEIVKANNGEWPADYEFRNSVIVPKVIKNITSLTGIIFFTSYFDIDSLSILKESGFKIILLEVPEDELMRRNIKNIDTKWDKTFDIHENLKYQSKLKSSGLVDCIIDGQENPDEISIKLDMVITGNNTIN